MRDCIDRKRAAAARVTIETILEEDLVGNRRRVGARMLAELQRWEREINPLL